MDIPTAISLMKEVCSKYMGTLVDHQNMQIAIAVIEKATGVAVPEPELKPKKPAKKQK